MTDMGLRITPAMFMTTVTLRYEFDAAVMITVGHPPRTGMD